MKILSFIPARLGSKRLKDKNFKNFLGKPLIDTTINFAKKINLNDIFVSTDSKKILAHCKKKGLNFKYLRPKKLSNDKSQIIDAVLHGLKWLKTQKKTYDAVLILQPSNPYRNTKELKKIINLFKKKKYESIASVSKAKDHPVKYFKFKNNKWNFLEKKRPSSFNSQDYPKDYYLEDGNVYLTKVNFLRKYKKFIVLNKTKLFKSSLSEKIDIDTYKDLKVSEFLIKNKLVKY